MKIYIHPKLEHFLTSKKRFLVVWGGRGGMKSWQISDILMTKTLTERNIVVLCTKQTQTSIADSVYSLIKKRIYDYNLQEFFQFTDKEIRCILTGSKFIFKGLLDPENSLKSLSNIKYCWVEEAQTLKEETWRILTPSIRAENSQIFVTFNPKDEQDIIYREFILQNNELADVVELQYWDNPFFPDVLRLEMERDKQRDYIMYEYIWEGKLKKIDPKALWKPNYILIPAVKERQLSRIVVAIDPSITGKETSDACGIVVAGRYSGEDRYIVLGDYTMIATPAIWARKAIELYQEYKADRIVAEVNQGGDMVETIIKNIDPTISYKAVHATRGKIIRAEPIAALYEEQQVDHVRHFAELEKELFTYTGEKGQQSPNRLDALVWALTELSGKGIKSMRGTIKSTYTMQSKLSNIKM